MEIFRDPQAVRHASIQTFLPWLQQHVQEIDSRIIKLKTNCKTKPINQKYKRIDGEIQSALIIYEV